jgi:hypothetical protein
MIEEWRPVARWPEYEVSNLGRVRRVETGAIRKPVSVSGYQAMRLTRPGGEGETILVHRAVALAFLRKPRRARNQVNHKDSNRWNPRLDNLEWVTASQNIKHGYDHGACCAKGARNGHSKLNDQAVAEIRASDSGHFPSLALRFGVSIATIRDVSARRTWKHLS